MQGYVDFDRFNVLEASLEELLMQIHKEPMTTTSWKWALISAHAALQGALCIALRGSAGFDTWKPHQLRKWLKAYDEGADLPEPQLDFFMELFDKLFDIGSGIDRRLISWLNETRNGLIHFNADSYSIERTSIVEAINEAVIATMATPTLSEGVFFYEERHFERFRALCETIGARLEWLVDA